jgi:hypothetical protein
MCGSGYRVYESQLYFGPRVGPYTRISFAVVKDPALQPPHTTMVDCARMSERAFCGAK